MEHFNLPDLVVVRDVDDEPFGDEDPVDVEMRGHRFQAIAQFRVAGRRCRIGVADAAGTPQLERLFGPPVDLTTTASDPVTLAGMRFKMWQLPEWAVDDGWTVLHIVLITERRVSVPRAAHRELLAALHFEHVDAPVRPFSMGTCGSDGVIQCTAEFPGHLTGLRAKWATIESLDHGPGA